MSDEWYGDRLQTAGNRCWWCGMPLIKGGPDGKHLRGTRTRDHTHPHLLTKSPLVEACAWCNGRKADRSTEDWRRFLLSENPKWDGVFYAEGVRDIPPLCFAPSDPTLPLRIGTPRRKRSRGQYRHSKTGDAEAKARVEAGYMPTRKPEGAS